MATRRASSGLTAFRRTARQLMTATSGMDLDDLDRRAKSVTGVSRARQAALDVQEREAAANVVEARLDAAGEERLRAELIRRLDALEAEILAAADSGPAG